MRAPRNLVFGTGQRLSLAGHARVLGNRVLVVTDARLEREPVFAELVDSLGAAGLAVKVFSAVDPELPRSCVAAGVDGAAGFDADVIVGIGGGSCMDAAKLIALLLAHGGDLADYYGEFKVPGPVLPLIAMPTTAGTGSEVTPVAVVADPERTLKVGIASPHLIPHTAICDPELTYTCPPALTAVSGADALTHAIEAYTTITREATPALGHEHVFVGKNALSDGFALSAIRHIGTSLRRAYDDGDDREARGHLMYGAMLAGLAFGVAGTSAAHAVQYPVGALTHTAHGAGVAVMLPYVMEFNRPYCTTALAQIADALGVARPDASDDANARSAINHVTAICAAIGIPDTLEKLGLKRDQLEWTATNAMGASRLVKNNPRPLDAHSMSLLVNAAFAGDGSGLHPA
ncbi:MAG TPA: iron-containing alcohol dehydrogenase [Devosiaceae bacterium]|jgi:alcohol dehydrogenase|nr:iron-containing alcohol dehydrogenase [Devosiaceae bacterium]